MITHHLRMKHWCFSLNSLLTSSSVTSASLSNLCIIWHTTFITKRRKIFYWLLSFRSWTSYSNLIHSVWELIWEKKVKLFLSKFFKSVCVIAWLLLHQKSCFTFLQWEIIFWAQIALTSRSKAVCWGYMIDDNRWWQFCIAYSEALRL